jgi:Na+-driven multidrug efflux pump
VYIAMLTAEIILAVIAITVFRRGKWKMKVV